MRFLVDRCAGRRLAQWLRSEGHDAMESRDLGADPGDRELLRVATDAKRILVTIDKDFGAFLFLERVAHCGVVRLPDCRSDERIAVMSEVLALHSSDLSAGAVVTVRRGRMRISRSR